VLIPALDILQSVPIFGFLSVTVTAFINLFPGSEPGLECASIFAIFTSMAWKMTFALHQSLVRPLVAWSQRFRLEQSAAAEQQQSVVLNLRRRSSLPHAVVKPLRPLGRALERITRPFGLAEHPLSRPAAVRGRAMSSSPARSVSWSCTDPGGLCPMWSELSAWVPRPSWALSAR
jgi:ABC-type anion transport system duplicated permease subunit